MIGIVYIGFPFGTGFRPSVKQTAKHNKQTAHTVSNQWQIFDKDKINNSCGVLSPRILFFVLAVFSTICHFDEIWWDRLTL
jgi:hypothetical protein